VARDVSRETCSLIEAANACITFTAETVADEEGDEQMKRRRFLIQNEYF
jgi:hypothetical protein